jgi:putative sigma-54 modulation protein
VAMRMTLRTVGVELSDRLRGYVERRLMFALGRFGRRVTTVSVWINDENGPKGGVDKKCTIAARLKGAGVVRVEEIGAELCPVVDCAAGRLDRAVSRRIERGQEVRVGRVGWNIR